MATPTLREHLKSRYGWTLIAFVILTALVGGLVIWQLGETNPTYWCALAENSSSENNACLAVLLKLVDSKDHALIGLMILLGVAQVGIVAVALGLNIRGTGLGGTSVDISARETEIDNGDVSVTIPTPPSEEK